MANSKIRADVLQLQDRDYTLLLGLFECRVMTTDHIATLYFDGKREYTKKRLQKLKAAGLIGERRRNANEPSILFLTRKAFILLTSRGELSGYPSLGKNSFEARANVSDLTLRHELEIMDVRAAFHAALLNSEKFSILEFSTWPLLHQFEMSHPGHGADVLVKPDGFIRIHEKEEGARGFAFDCFLEVDRSSEKQNVLIAKTGCYLEYYKSGGFAVRNGSTRDKFKEFPFRVLLVLKSAERRNNTAERLVHNNPPVLTQTWLTTFAEVTADPLGAIWIQPKDYREVTKGTPFEAKGSISTFGYHRQPGREIFIEKNIKKLPLLES
jgi:hypothetical protein